MSGGGHSGGPQRRKGGRRKQPQRAEPPPLCSLDAAWIASLSEPELDFLISLKQLAITRCEVAGHPDLANKFDAGTLRALGAVLLEHLKDQLKSTLSHSVIADLIDKLPLLSATTPENVNLENSTRVATTGQEQVHDGGDNTEAESLKKQKITVKEEPVDE